MTINDYYARDLKHASYLGLVELAVQFVSAAQSLAVGGVAFAALGCRLDEVARPLVKRRDVSSKPRIVREVTEVGVLGLPCRETAVSKVQDIDLTIT